MKQTVLIVGGNEIVIDTDGSETLQSVCDKINVEGKQFGVRTEVVNDAIKVSVDYSGADIKIHEV
jgi:hypothetical protein